MNETDTAMERIVNKNCIYDLELQSLHYWFKNAPSQNPLNKYNNVLKIMENTIYKNDISDVIDISIQNYTKSCVNFHDRKILRNVFGHWKMYVVHKLHSKRATYKANYFYKKKLQKTILNILSKNVLLKWQHIVLLTNRYSNQAISSLNDTKAEKHYRKTLLKQYFTFWLNYISKKNEKKTLLEEAIAFYNTYCLKKCIFNWKIYLSQQRKKKEIQDKAYQFYTKCILQKCITAWISICELMSLKDKVGNAITHHNSKLLLKYFLAWKTYHRFKLQKLNTEKYIQTYYRKKLLKQYFKHFIMYVNESIADKLAQENARASYNIRLMKKAFTAWQCWYNEKVEKDMKMHQIKNIFESTQKRTILINWCLYVINKKCKRRKFFMSQYFYNKQLTIKVVRKLHSYAIYKKEKRVKLFYLNDKSKNIIQRLQYIYIEKWKRALYSAVQEKQKLNQAIRFWELNLAHKYFLYWKEFSQQHKTKMLRKEHLQSIATNFLLRKFILHWHVKLQNVLVIREKEALVISMMEHKIMRKYVLSWKGYVAEKVKMKNRIEIAKELHKKFLLRDGLKEILRNSLRNIVDQHDMQLEDVATRSFTNFEILKEYFDRWYSLIYLKNKSKPLCNVSQFSQSETLNTRILDNLENTRLVLPEYMKKKVTITYTE